MDPIDSAFLGLSSGNSALMRVLMECEDIVPGQSPSYEAVKTIYSYHPLGSRMVDKPIEMAMSQEREIKISGAPQEDLLEAFTREWERIGGIGANQIIYRLTQLSRIYGISTLAVNSVGKDGKHAPTNEPLPVDKLHELDLYFNIYDPLNTSGSLVLNQDPAAVDFMHPSQVTVGGDSWSNTKIVVMMHEQPIWIQWTDSAFGFVGRSVYQRAYYPLKSFVASMIADNLIQDKLALIIHKAKSPGSVIDKRTLAFFGAKRQALKGAKTGNIVQIGTDEEMQSLDLEHVQGAGEYSRSNILKNIATGAGMPAVLLNEETLTEGFGEGSEDAKQIARYIDRVRLEMGPAYQFMDNVVRRRAWNPEFYAGLQHKYPEQYGKLKYEAAFQEWVDRFKAKWPNLLSEPDSELLEGEERVVKCATDAVNAMMTHLDPENKASAIAWLADVLNGREKMFGGTQLDIDAELITVYKPEPAKPDESV